MYKVSELRKGKAIRNVLLLQLLLTFSYSIILQ